jgi:hypothetical protein
VDQNFLDIYVIRRDQILAKQSPYVIVKGSSLYLIRNGQATPARVIPDSYHALKDVAHIPFAVYLFLSPVDEHVVTPDSGREGLKKLSAEIEKAQGEIRAEWFSPEQAERQRKILSDSLQIVNATLATNEISHESLLQFIMTMGPLMKQNAWDAGCVQVRATHAQMMKWKSQLNSEEWRHLIVLNRGGHQPRYKNVDTQYFSWLLQDKGASWSYPGESMRVIYVEALGKEETEQTLLGAAELDAAAGAAFFGDPWRLSEDILSEGAASCIADLSPDDRQAPN